MTGSSSGFGLLMATKLSKKHIVYATMRNIKDRDKLDLDVVKNKGSVIVHPLDVTNSKSIFNVIKTIRSEQGRLDVLINNAGYALGGHFEDLTEKEIREQMDTNFFGVQKVTREALPLMRENKSGLIINMSSVAGLSALPCTGAYNASKWALEGFSESLLFELAPYKIKVVLVEPGVFKTKILTENLKLAKYIDRHESPYYQASQKMKKRLKANLDRSKADPMKVADLVEKIIHTNNPKFRHVIGRDAKARLLLRRLLPFSLYAWIVNTILNSKQ